MPDSLIDQRARLFAGLFGAHQGDEGRLAPLAILLALATPVAALAGPVDDIVRLDMLPGWRAEDGTQMAGFRITLAPGWKTYWRAPGEAGSPRRASRVQPPTRDWRARRFRSSPMTVSAESARIT